jgi:biopolymer transport protein ExbB/TolQ
MSLSLEMLMYQLSQLFLLPVLAAIIFLFLYSFYALGGFGYQAWQRRRALPAGFELLALKRAQPSVTLVELEALAAKRLELARLATRIAPMLGLAATMIPMGPALQSLAGGQLADVSHHLTVAFSAVILALLAAALTYWVANVRRRWYITELAQLEAVALVPAPDEVAKLAQAGVE